MMIDRPRGRQPEWPWVPVLRDATVTQAVVSLIEHCGHPPGHRTSLGVTASLSGQLERALR